MISKSNLILKRKGFIYILFLTCYSSTLLSQSNSIKFNLSYTYGDANLNLADSTFTLEDTTDLQITALRFYISGIQFLKGDQLVMAEGNSFHLIDAGTEDSFQLSISNEENVDFDKVKFNLGIDSTTNVSGAMGGDLDPIKGMYWTWQSGYINFKLEGNSKQCDTRNNEFVFHLGGYLSPNYCLQTLIFPVYETDSINLTLDVKSILSQIELSKTNHIMSPSLEAVGLSEIVANAFIILK